MRFKHRMLEGSGSSTAVGHVFKLTWDMGALPRKLHMIWTQDHTTMLLSRNCGVHAKLSATIWEPGWEPT